MPSLAGLRVTLYRTRQLISAPILCKGKLLKGVTEVINKIGLDRFTKEDERDLAEICKVVGLPFRIRAGWSAGATSSTSF